MHPRPVQQVPTYGARNASLEINNRQEGLRTTPIPEGVPKPDAEYFANLGAY